MVAVLTVEKNPHAQALGRLGGLRRAETLSEAKLRSIGAVGGHARATALTKGERTEAGRRAATARWRRRYVREWLSRLGAPLVAMGMRKAAVMPRVEEVLAAALRLAHDDTAVARAFPVALWRNRSAVNLDELKRLARRDGEEQALGFFLDLTSRLSGDPDFRRAAELVPGNVGEPTHFFRPAGGPLERRRAMQQTPDVARRWGFYMNMPIDVFASTFGKARR